MLYPQVHYLGPAHPDVLHVSAPTGAAPNLAAPATPRELDARAGDGIHVRLLWHPTDGHVSVAVADSKTGETFDLPVRDGDRVLDVFHHPFAYAAGRRVGTGRAVASLA